MQSLLSWIFIGIATGILLGLTSLDVGLLSVLLINLMIDSVSWMDSLIYALIPLTLAGWTFWWPRRHETDYLTAAQLAVFSFSGSLLVARFKMSIPIWVLAFCFLAAAVWTLFHWFLSFQNQQPMAVIKNSENPKHPEWLVSLAGLALGAFITVTGLSCLFFINPFLMKTLKLNRSRAMATAWFSILIAAPGSFLLQVQVFAFSPSARDLACLLSGLLVTLIVCRLCITQGTRWHKKPVQRPFKAR